MKDELAHNPCIKTQISNFCQQFAAVLVPLKTSLHDGLESIQGKADSDALQTPVATLTDVYHRLDGLVHKVEEQQAYVIIFGPLKSGKSTLMNAISASYVSEVTSLPAYPCLVHVKHGEDSKFVVTRYTGGKVSYSDNRSLHQLIQQSHEVLADRIREVEQRGDDFDPGVHYPEAIRRIDVEVPAKNLKDSLTVLVDTPGLYSRMKFGYSLMAKEFRNSAASAVFVVKTDNLFLEQVFDEFNDLLDLFSRIFLVVNIDTNKRDISPDGSYRRSIESEHPEQVVKAFESLVMSAPLRKAADEGRLKIYPIDLLSAAVQSLKKPTPTSAPAPTTPVPAPDEFSKDSESSPDTSAEIASPISKTAAKPVRVSLAARSPVATESFETESSASASPTSDALDSENDSLSAPAPDTAPLEAEPAESLEPKRETEEAMPQFNRFLDDLTSYLNSNAYLQEFMGDSLHQGKTLAAEILSQTTAESLTEFQARQSTLQKEIQEITERLAAVEKLDSLDWAKSFEKVRNNNRNECTEFGKRLLKETTDAAMKHVAAWFESDESVVHLQEERLNKLFRDCQEKIVAQIKERTRAVVGAPLGGVELDQDLVHAISRVEKVIDPAVRSSRDVVQTAKPPVKDFRLQIPHETLRVKKGFWDWLLLRTQAAVCRRIFGAPDNMDMTVPSSVKKRRLDQEGRESVERLIRAHLESVLPATAVEATDKLLTNFITALAKDAKQRLQSGKDEIVKKKHALERRRADNRRIEEFFKTLGTQAESTIEAIAGLRQTFQAVDWENRGQLTDPSQEAGQDGVLPTFPYVPPASLI